MTFVYFHFVNPFHCSVNTPGAEKRCSSGPRSRSETGAEEIARVSLGAVPALGVPFSGLTVSQDWEGGPD